MVVRVSEKFSHKLAVNGIACVAGGQTLFSARSFTLSKGEFLAVYGANGSGKSCLLRSLCGCDNFVRAGVRVFWDEQPIALSELAKDCMRVGHKVPFLASLSLFENLQFWSDILAAEARIGIDNLKHANANFALASFWHEPTWRLSAGQRQRGALSMLALKPQASLWLLDEPHAALDSDGRACLKRCIENHLNNGGMAIVASHEDLSAIAQHRLTLCE